VCVCVRERKYVYITRVYPDTEQVGCLFLEHHPRGFGTVPTYYRRPHRHHRGRHHSQT